MTNNLESGTIFFWAKQGKQGRFGTFIRSVICWLLRWVVLLVCLLHDLVALCELTLHWLGKELLRERVKHGSFIEDSCQENCTNNWCYNCSDKRFATKTFWKLFACKLVPGRLDPLKQQSKVTAMKYPLLHFWVFSVGHHNKIGSTHIVLMTG